MIDAFAASRRRVSWLRRRAFARRARRRRGATAATGRLIKQAGRRDAGQHVQPPRSTTAGHPGGWRRSCSRPPRRRRRKRRQPGAGGHGDRQADHPDVEHHRQRVGRHPACATARRRRHRAASAAASGASQTDRRSGLQRRRQHGQDRRAPAPRPRSTSGRPARTLQRDRHLRRQRQHRQWRSAAAAAERDGTGAMRRGAGSRVRRRGRPIARSGCGGAAGTLPSTGVIDRRCGPSRATLCPADCHRPLAAVRGLCHGMRRRCRAARSRAALQRGRRVRATFAGRSPRSVKTVSRARDVTRARRHALSPADCDEGKLIRVAVKAMY